jgi:hypothetical protein
MKVLLYQFHLNQNKLSFSTKDKYISDYGEYWKLSSNTCKIYAEKWGWDYIFDNPTPDEWNPFCISEPQFEQFRCIEYLLDYDAVLFVDSDILIKPNSPNIVNEYSKNGTPVVVNTVIGNKLLGEKDHSIIGLNTGVVIWYKNSENIINLPYITGKHYFDTDVYPLGSFIESRKKLKWWEQLEDFKPFIGKFESGFYNDDKFLTFLISVYNIPISHLHSKYNYRFTINKECDILSDNVYFVHYIKNMKSYIQKHYNLIMEQ